MIYTWLFLGLYVSSMFVGRALKLDGSRLMTPVVLVLVFTVSAWASTEVVVRELEGLLFRSLAFTAMLVLLTLGIGALLRGGRGNLGEVKSSFPFQYPAALVAGWVFGILFRTPLYSSVVTCELYVLAVVVGISMWRGLSLRTVRAGGARALLSTAVALLGSAVGAGLFSFLTGLRFNVALGIALGMGWYSFTGPAIAAYVSPYYGVVAFLVNFLREQVTYVLVPALRRDEVGLLALGGATTMDDTLPVFVSTFGPEAGVSAAVNGVILTLIVPILVTTVVSI
ncbi:hypothetical protein HS1genome_1513 [Sulfodiicoccus acidiphilus]|uniref:Lysine exporter LysO family protein n=1 Tax=Sulfodiicoccus acidiphilus TaxID=1670455 RepID=A0A348B4M2_9CREN|nr:lysine exporter LysO family protein [Sulfodiicoccus acidiphilus]BBD73124.1 hypothetical protein HS1genome_1513 [Sulfodiicoccus acidiphilus]GGU00634.1 hypothetical protein GCM10007116_17340 [Sulfodiicoccus acidiphilus]